MKFQLKHSDFNQETGISKVTIATELGYFNGISKLHDEDQDIASNFAGCRYAEYKAIIKYIQTKKRYIKYQIKILQNIEKELINRKDYNKYSIENRKIRKNIYKLNNDIKLLDDKIKSLSNKILAEMQNRRIIIDKITNKGDEK